MCVCDRIFALWGRPFVDLFATRQNRRLPQFVSPTDALSMDWSGLDVYLFPPFTLLLTVLCKIHVSPGRFLGVASNWPAQPWFPVLLRLLVDLSRCLPLWPDLLTQRRGRVLHPNVPILQLHAWLLSSDSLKLRDFRSTLPDVPLRQYDPAPPPSTTPKWCGGRKTDLFAPSVIILCAFFTELHQRPLSLSAVKGYRSSLNTVFRAAGQVHLLKITD